MLLLLLLLEVLLLLLLLLLVRQNAGAVERRRQVPKVLELVRVRVRVLEACAAEQRRPAHLLDVAPRWRRALVPRYRTSPLHRTALDGGGRGGCSQIPEMPRRRA